MFTNHDQAKIKEIVREVEAETLKAIPPRARDVRTPLPTLAKADADIAALALGTFTLQANKPDALSDGATTRDAYALSDLKLGELAMLDWCVGEASQGFWAATAVGTPQTTEDCLCLIKNIVLANFTLTDAEQTELSDLCGMCNASSATCSNCLSGSTPDPIAVAFNILNTPATPGEDLGTDWVATLGGDHEVPMTGCSGQIAIPVPDSTKAHPLDPNQPLGTEYRAFLNVSVEFYENQPAVNNSSVIRTEMTLEYFNTTSQTWVDGLDGAVYTTTAVDETKVDCEAATSATTTGSGGGAESAFWLNNGTTAGGTP